MQPSRPTAFRLLHDSWITDFGPEVSHLAKRTIFHGFHGFHSQSAPYADSGRWRGRVLKKASGWAMLFLLPLPTGSGKSEAI